MLGFLGTFSVNFEIADYWGIGKSVTRGCMEKVKDIKKAIPYFLNMPSKKIWVDYDEEADVLYISFRKPQQANDSIMEEDIIYHYHDKELVGLTILHDYMPRENLKWVAPDNGRDNMAVMDMVGRNSIIFLTDTLN